MKKIIVASLMLFAPAAALAADLPGKAPAVLYSPTSAEPVANWSGFYVGANVGGGFGEVSATSLATLTNANLSAIAGSAHRSGLLGGVQGGYSLQTGSVVYGLEADFDLGGLRGSYNASGVINMIPTGASAPVAVPVSARLDSKLTAVSTIRGRLGYTFDKVLIYGTGGFATAHHEGKGVAAINAGGSVTGSVKDWVNGWTLGVGGEYLLTRNVSLKLEYLYAHLGERVLGQSVNHSINMLRTGANYRF